MWQKVPQCNLASPQYYIIIFSKYHNITVSHMMSLAMVNVADEYPIGSCSNVVFHLRTNVTSDENVH